MAPERDSDSAPSSSGQSKRPPLSRQHSEVSEGQHRPRQYQKQRHAGRLHTRVPSSKALHKQQSQSHAQQHHQSTTAGSKAGPNSSSARRVLSPTEPVTPQQPLKSHQRTTSEVRLPWENAPSSLQKSASQTNIKRNRSHGEIHRRTRSTDKIKRHSGGPGTGGASAAPRPKSSKGQVHFDLGSDDQDEDEWVDASGSNSPHLSRKGSINSSTQSSLRPHATSVAHSRPETPQETTQQDTETETEAEQVPAAETERDRRPSSTPKAYPTNRLLKRTPSHLAQPKMSTEIAQASQPRLSPESPGPNSLSMPASGGKEGLTSRFVNTPGSERTSEGSFYRPPTSNGLQQPEEPARRARSAVDLSKAHEAREVAQVTDDRDDSALVPKSGRGAPGKPVEPSRIQQKLNLQRASSVIETRHNPPSVADNIGSSPLIAVGGPGYDGAGSRDPRMSKLLGQTGMEYLVVRRHQNPVARSLARLGVTASMKTKRIPRANTGSTNSKRSFDMAPRHARKISASRPVTPRDAASIRTAAGSSFEGEDENRLSERLSGASLVGGEEDDGTAAILRSLWEKSMDLSASAD